MLLRGEAPRGTIIIPESDLYRLILRSNMPIAEWRISWTQWSKRDTNKYRRQWLWPGSFHKRSWKAADGLENRYRLKREEGQPIGGAEILKSLPLPKTPASDTKEFLQKRGRQNISMTIYGKNARPSRGRKQRLRILKLNRASRRKGITIYNRTGKVR